MIALGERAKWGAEENGSGAGGGGSGDSTQQDLPSQRWVQFGAVYISRLSVEQPAAAGLRATQPAAAAVQQQQGAAAGSGTCGAGGGSGGKQLADYLALPVEDYSLLDPKWISRQGVEPPSLGCLHAVLELVPAAGQRSASWRARAVGAGDVATPWLCLLPTRCVQGGGWHLPVQPAAAGPG